jgi:hypothetical protein
VPFAYLSTEGALAFSVDLARRDSLLERFLTLMFLPRRAIAVTAAEASPAPEPMPWTTTPRGAMWLGTGGLIGAMVALSGLDHGLTAVAVLGAVVRVSPPSTFRRLDAARENSAGVPLVSADSGLTSANRVRCQALRESENRPHNVSR